MAAASRALLWRRPRRRTSSSGGGSGRTSRQPPSSRTRRSIILGSSWTSGTRSRSSSSAQIEPCSSRSPDTYARAMPSSPGAVTIRRRASGERITIVAGASTGPDLLPSYASTATVRPPPSTSSTNAAKAIAPPLVSWFQPGYAAVVRRSPGAYPEAALGNPATVFLLPVPLVEGQRHHPGGHLGAAHVDGHV